MMIGMWIEFDYTDLNGIKKTWNGEIVEKHLWGYKINTEDGVRSFRRFQMKNIKQLA